MADNLWLCISLSIIAFSTTNTALEITEINYRIMYCECNKTASSDFSNMSNRLSKWQHNDLQPKLSAMADNLWL
jgi:hypothetical protein